MDCFDHERRDGSSGTGKGTGTECNELGTIETGTNGLCTFLRIPQAAFGRPATIGTAGAACGIRKRHKKVWRRVWEPPFLKRGFPTAVYNPSNTE